MIKNNILIFLFISSFSSYAMLCPTNFNQIEIGDSINHVLQSCGSPQSQYESNYSESMAQHNTNSYAYSSNAAIAHTMSHQVNQNIVITTFIYKFPQKAVLIFKNGTLIERKLPVPGDN